MNDPGENWSYAKLSMSQFKSLSAPPLGHLLGVLSKRCCCPAYVDTRSPANAVLLWLDVPLFQVRAPRQYGLPDQRLRGSLRQTQL